MGPTAILEIVVAMPPVRKSLVKEIACSVMVVGWAVEQAESHRVGTTGSAQPPLGPKGCLNFLPQTIRMGWVPLKCMFHLTDGVTAVRL